jgi:hypothetical protein
MWEYSSDGNLYFDKFVQGFVDDVYKRFASLSTNHFISIIYFSRSFISKKLAMNLIANGENIEQYYDGRYYKDMYRLVVEGHRGVYHNLTVLLKREFNAYPHLNNWNDDGSSKDPNMYNSSSMVCTKYK